MPLLTGGSVYVDSNVLIYILQGDPKFGNIARTFLTACIDGRYQACISDAVCSEVLTGPYRAGDAHAVDSARALVDNADLFLILPHSHDDFVSAARLRGQQGMGFVDALHVATASNNGCDALVTNDRRLVASSNPLVVPLQSLAEV